MVQDFPPLVENTNSGEVVIKAGYVPSFGTFCLNPDVQDGLDCLIFFLLLL